MSLVDVPTLTGRSRPASLWLVRGSRDLGRVRPMPVALGQQGRRPDLLRSSPDFRIAEVKGQRFWSRGSDPQHPVPH
jgi:hypothetical protein